MKTKATIVIERGCLVGVYGVDQYQLCDIDNLRESTGFTRKEIDKLVDQVISKAGKEAANYRPAKMNTSNIRRG